MKRERLWNEKGEIVESMGERLWNEKGRDCGIQILTKT